MQNLICSICGKSKPITTYRVHFSKDIGHYIKTRCSDSMCKFKQSYEMLPIDPNNTPKICTICGQTKKVNEFHINVDGIVYPACINCRRIMSKNHYKNNKKLYIQRAIKWRADNPEQYREIVKKSYHKNKGE